MKYSDPQQKVSKSTPPPWFWTRLHQRFKWSQQVGREMVTSTDDEVLRQDMPAALQKVESAAKLLEEAAKMSQVRQTMGG